MDMNKDEGVLLDAKGALNTGLLIKDQFDVWNRNRPKHYQYVISKTCFCFDAPTYGPNEIEIKNGEIIRITYRGETRDGFKAGDSLIDESATAYTIDELFAKANEIVSGKRRSSIARIRSQNSEDRKVNRRFLIEFDPIYGFPKRLGYDEDIVADEEWSILIENFKVIR